MEFVYACIASVNVFVYQQYPRIVENERDKVFSILQQLLQAAYKGRNSVRNDFVLAILYSAHCWSRDGYTGLHVSGK